MTNEVATPEPLLRKPRVLEIRGDSNTTLYRDIQAGLFTKPVKVGPRKSAWPASEVDALLKARIAGKPADDIRLLVRALEAKRAHAADDVMRAALAAT